MTRRMNSVTRANLVAVTVASICAAHANAQTAPAAPAAPAAPPAPTIQSKTITPNAIANTRFSFSGFIKFDALWTKTDDGDIADDTAGRDFYVPASIPVGNPAASEGADLKAHVKQSRFIFGTDTDLANKSTLSSRLEIDLYGSALGNQRVSNWYGLLVRQAYVQYNGWMVGQAWTNFQDLGVFPDSVDFIGTTDGTLFVRQAQVRYTSGGFSISAENPETTITTFNGAASVASDDGILPDITAAYNFKFGNGSNVRIAALVRQLKYEVASATAANAINESEMAGGLSVAAKFAAGKNDDIRFSVTYGKGIGRYLGLNFVNDAVLTSATLNAASLETINGYGATLAWRHVWSPAIRTNIMFAQQSYDNEAMYTGGNVNQGSNSAAVNMFYTPTPKLDVGFEVRVGKRELESGTDGSLKRFQITTKYSF